MQLKRLFSTHIGGLGPSIWLRLCTLLIDLREKYWAYLKLFDYISLLHY